MEETYAISKRRVSTGKVRVQTRTKTVEETAHADLLEETAEVTRVPIDRLVEEAPTVRTEGDLTVIPVVEEIMVVEKRLRLVEEIHIRRRLTTHPVSVPVELRKQHVDIKTITPDVDKRRTP